MDYKKWVALSILSVSAIFPDLAFGWNKHQALMPLILSSTQPRVKQALDRTFALRCGSEDKNRLATLAAGLQLNPNAKFPSVTALKCGEGASLSVHDLLVSAVDDPDQGMDRDLPSDLSYDPKQERRWMGGSSGFSSQGFRHQYLGGWKPSKPLTTFQIPSYAVGQAPFRVEILAQRAKDLLRSGDLAWGARLLAWSIHYIQDLNQPFHSVQTVSIGMVPLNELFSWPPRAAIQEFIKQTVRTVTNFHWAYEGYTLERVLENHGRYTDCLSKPEPYSSLRFDPKTQTPLDLAFSVVHESVGLADDLGAAEVKLFGTQLMPRGADMTQNPNLIDFKNYSPPSDLLNEKEELDRVTCRALANTSLATRKLLEWALQP